VGFWGEGYVEWMSRVECWHSANGDGVDGC
jgi:hypothetical protein